MTRATLDHLVDRFLDHHFAFHPVDASFMGVAGHDARLPRADARAIAAEEAGLAAIASDLAQLDEPASAGARIDRRLLDSQIAIARAALRHRPHLRNPAWLSGEAGFAVIALLLPQADPTPREAVRDRLRGIPDFLSDGAARLKGEAVPTGWRDRARSECAAFARFLQDDLQKHPSWDDSWRGPAEAAAAAFKSFAAAIETAPDRDFAAGRDQIALLMRTGYGFETTPEQAEAAAEQAYARLGAELEEDAAGIDKALSWREQIAALSDRRAPNDDVDGAYRYWHARAMADAAHLVTPARDYDLSFRRLPSCFATIAPQTYFLSYRSPPAARAGAGSVYWIPGPGDDHAAWLRAHNPTTIKIIHAAHHGSIGHHTQNARARVAPSRLARLAATDCASALGFFPAGAMAEGWACYVMGLMRECPDFYDPAELLLLKQHERRDAASVLVDIRLHSGRWSAADAARFYEDAGFAPARIPGEITRNSMFPGSRLMYWLGAEQIKAMRRAWRGEARDFHDQLIGYGSIPPAWAADEMRAATRDVMRND